VIPIEVIYAKSTLGSGDSGYGALLASWGIGMVLGSVVFAGMRERGFPLLLMFSTVAVGISYLGLAAAPTLQAERVWVAGDALVGPSTVAGAMAQGRAAARAVLNARPKRLVEVGEQVPV